MFLLARQRHYPDMKLKSWNWLYHSRYSVFCFETGLKLESFDVFMAAKNVRYFYYQNCLILLKELGMRRNRTKKRDREEESESEASCSDSEEDNEKNTKSKMRAYSKTMEQVIMHLCKSTFS